MLYLVSGTSRSGKTRIAKSILQAKKIPYLSLDWLVMGFTNGMPEVGIHDKLFPDEIARRMWPFVEAMCESMIWLGNDFVIEGEAILPEHVEALRAKHPEQLRVCFVGYTDVAVGDKVASIKAHRESRGDWLVKESDAYISEHVENMIAHSRLIQAGCAKHHLRYFDTSADFLSAVDEATRYLLGPNED